MTTQITNNLDELIEQERRRASERIAKLKRAAAAEQRLINEKVVAILHEQDADLYEQLADEARDALADEKAKRSIRARKSDTPTLTVPAQQASRDDEHGEEVRVSWQ